MGDERVFRFMVLRQPTAAVRGHSTVRRSYSVTGEAPALEQQVLALPVRERNPQEILKLATQAMRSGRYVKELGLLPLDLAPLGSWVEENAAQPLKSLDLAAFLQRSYGAPPAELAGSGAFVESAMRLAETLLADELAGANRGRRRDDIVHAIKLLHLARSCTEVPSPLSTDEMLGAFFARLIVLLPQIERPLAPAKTPTVKPAAAAAEQARVRAKRERLEGLAAAHDELVRALGQPGAIVAAARDITSAATVAPGAGTPAPAAPQAAPVPPGLTAVLKLAHGASTSGTSGSKPQIRLAAPVAQRLSAPARAVLGSLGLDALAADPLAMVDALESQLAATGAAIPAAGSPRRIITFGGAGLDADRFERTWGLHEGTLERETLPARPECRFSAGVGDLLIVRQTLKAYSLGDFAHVENVLAGESRTREHRRLAVREEITVAEAERETQKERDLQSSERYEMQNEASKVVQDETSLEAGLQVCGAYGPAVSFSASLNTSFATSTEESQRKATGYSREITEKAAERVRERVREEQRRRVLEQVEEINVHSVRNDQSPAGHVRGIYRWLDKVYDAQVFNYGKRMMYEFVLPEPAAYFLYALVENPPRDMIVEKAEPPTWPIDGGAPLRPQNLTRANYQDYLAKYEVTGAKPPPPSFQNLAHADSQEGVEESNYERKAKIVIGPGYEAVHATGWAWYTCSLRPAGRGTFEVAVGGHNVFPGVAFPTPYRNEVSFGVHGFFITAFVVTVDILCRLTAEGFAAWQHETFDAIVEAYLEKKAAYDERMAQQAIQRGVQILGRNPGENRRIERDELRKLALMTLTRNVYPDVNGFFGGAEPVMDLARACANGAAIRFLENAFEWANATYVFYPYFWGRHARWIGALHLTDPDPDFAAFLRAGAARLQVPVRPGFERAVAHYCQTGEAWDGSDVPLIGDSLYVPIVEEITRSLGQEGEAVPYPEGSKPWEVVVPTSLVVVQDLAEVPGIRDALTGAPVSLGAHA